MRRDNSFVRASLSCLLPFFLLFYQIFLLISGRTNVNRRNSSGGDSRISSRARFRFRRRAVIVTTRFCCCFFFSFAKANTRETARESARGAFYQPLRARVARRFLPPRFSLFIRMSLPHCFRVRKKYINNSQLHICSRIDGRQISSSPSIAIFSSEATSLNPTKCNEVPYNTETEAKRTKR